MCAASMNLGEVIVIALLWSILLLALSYRMLFVSPASRYRYAEIIGCLILLALITLLIALISGPDAEATVGQLFSGLTTHPVD